MIAVAATGTLPPLGFVHEDASIAFCLNIADLYRTEITIPIAFEAVSQCHSHPEIPIERQVRRLAGIDLKRKKYFKND
jgi:CRISPR-associated protein Cas1